MFPKFEKDEINQYEKCLLPKLPNHHMNAADKGVSGSVSGNIAVSLVNPPSLVLPPILPFGGHLQYPSSMIPSSKNVDYFKLLPPLNFNHQVDKSLNNSITKQPPQLTPLKESSISNIVKELKNNRIKHPMNNDHFQEIPRKKAKFDFSIEALTADDKRATMKPLKEISQNIMNPMMVNNDNIKVASATSIKSRGRPSADLIEILKQHSMQNPHRYSCSVCHRSFPRKKSLDTHRLTHSDVKPYACDFPGCNRKFKQSGQLKTHLRLHTGEKPFKCTYPYCATAFTHANRKCSLHPEFPLRRSSTDNLSTNQFINMCSEKLSDSENVEKIKNWFENYLANRESKLNDNKENIPPLELNQVKQDSSEDETVDVEIESDDSCRFPQANEENNKRLLSAVALVELRDQMKEPNKKKENYTKLFSTHHNL